MWGLNTRFCCTGRRNIEKQAVSAALLLADLTAFTEPLLSVYLYGKG